MATSYPEDKKEPTEAAPSSPAVRSSIEKRDHYSDDNSSIYVEGSEGVTHEEYNTLRHVRDHITWTSWVVVFVEFAERWTYYGTVNIYNNYMRFKLPRGSINGAVPVEDRKEGVAGALGLGVQRSYAIRTFATFFTYITPILGAVIADVWWGRFKTIVVFSLVAILGHVLLVISATPKLIANTHNASLTILVLSVVINAIGTGAIKSNVSPLVAEQYTGKLRKVTLKSGEVVLKSPSVTIQSIYLWFYLAINLGSCGAISASFISRAHGYWVAFLVPTVIMFLVPGVLAAAKPYYVKTPPRGSIILETFRVVRICVGPAFSVNPVRFYRNLRADEFWNVAKPSTYRGDTVPSKITWDDEFVGEVARTCSALKVFLFFPIFWLCYSQIDGNLGTMAGAMTLEGTPNDLIQNLNPITLVILIPIFDFWIYPFLRRKGINFTPIKRITFGFMIAGLAMVYAAVLQHYLYDTSPCHDGEPSACESDDGLPLHSPLNVWIVSGPYILVAIAEIFASITSLEYAFTKAPKRMKSVVMAFAQLQTGIASAINLALASVNTEPKFQWLFTSFAIVSWIAAGLFYWIFRETDAREGELNIIGTGEREGFIDEQPTATA